MPRYFQPGPSQASARFRVARPCRLAGILLCLVFAQAQAQAPSWNAAALLGDASQGAVRLRSASGQVVDEVALAQVQRSADVLQRLARAYGMAAPQLHVIASNAPNAFASKREGGPVVGITTGMLRLAGDQDEYLAAVLGHELGHLQAGHAAARRERSQLITTFGAIVGAAVDISLGWRGYSSGGAGIELGGLGADLLNAKFSRDQEREADRLGTEAMAKAGFDPAVAVEFWKRVAGATPSGEGFWLNTHPPHAERAAELAARARELAPVLAANQAQPKASTSAVRETVVLGTPLGPAADTKALPVAALARTAAPVPVPPVQIRVPDAEAAALGRLAMQHLHGGNGLPRDHAKARAYGERAALAGDPAGMAVYGTMLREGIAGPADPQRGIALLTEAAAGDVPWAHYQLGLVYRLGLGVAADRQRALQHLAVAAPSIIAAQDLLSRMRAESQ